MTFETQHVVAIAIAFIIGLAFGIAISYKPTDKDRQDPPLFM